LASNLNETPWKTIGWWKATFPVQLPLYCAVLTSAPRAVYTRLPEMITIRFSGWMPVIQKLLLNGNRIRIRISETLL